MPSTQYNLILAAHPDDETIFFSSIILKGDAKTRVLCVTDGNADGQGQKRYAQFEDACRQLGVDDFQFLGFPDIYDRRLNYEELAKSFSNETNLKAVYTHGPTGEYMHPHHQDLSYAVHRFFQGQCDIYVPAYNCFASKVMELSQDEYQLKAKILSEVYGSETRRFLNLIPCTQVETFVALDFSEVDEIYQVLTGRKVKLDRSLLKAYRWLAEYLEIKAQEDGKRLF